MIKRLASIFFKTLNVLSSSAVFASCAMIFLIIINQADLPFGHFTMVRPFTIAIYIAAGVYILTLEKPGGGRKTVFEKFHDIISDDRNFTILAAFFFGLYILETLNMWFSFRIMYDFSIFDEALYNGYNGPEFMYSRQLGLPFLTHHFSPILAALIPFHAVFRSPYFLLLVHPVALFASMPVLRAVLRAAGGFSAFAVNFICLLYLNNPIIIKTLLGGFHVEVFLPLALFSAYYFYLKDKPALYYPLLIAALAVKEDVGFYMLGLAFFMAVSDGKYFYGLFTALISISWSLAAIFVAVPYLSGSGAGYAFLVKWSPWGGNIAKILYAMATHPVRLAQYLLGWPSLGLFSCLLFVPFLRLRTVPLFFIPWLVNSTSSSELSWEYAYYYGLPILAFAAIAMTNNLKPLLANENEFKFKDAVLKVMCITALTLNFAHFVFPDCGADHFEFREKILAIPPEKTVQAATEIFGHLDYTARKSAILDYSRLNAEFILLPRRLYDLARPFSGEVSMDAGAMDMAVEPLLNSGNYKINFKNSGFMVLEKITAKK